MTFMLYPKQVIYIKEYLKDTFWNSYSAHINNNLVSSIGIFNVKKKVVHLVYTLRAYLFLNSHKFVPDGSISNLAVLLLVAMNPSTVGFYIWHSR